MKHFLYIFILVLGCYSLKAQDKASVSGTVLVKETKEPVLQSSVLLLKASDSAIITGVSTNAGKFTINTTPGKYLVLVSAMGYADVIKPIDAVKGQNALVDFLLEESDDILLDTATVKGFISAMVIRGDTIEYNADSYKVLPSAVVEDLLKKLPGAEVSDDGSITVNGRSVSKILVDKKEFFSDDPKVATKNLLASIVDKVQVWDKKSDMAEMTGFDDGNEETIINLSTKNGAQGFFANASLGVGTEDKYSGNIFANYMNNVSRFTLLGGANNTNGGGFTDRASASFGGGARMGGLSFGGGSGIIKSTNGGFDFASELSDKFKWGGSISYGGTNNDAVTDSYTQNYISSGDQFTTSNAKGNNTSHNINGNFRMEWTPTENTKVIFTPRVSQQNNTNQQQNQYLTTLLNPNDTVNWGNSNSYSKSSGLNINGALEMSHKFNKKGRTLSMSFSGGLSDQTTNSNSYSLTEYTDVRANNVLRDQATSTTNDSYNFRGYLSIVEPLGNNNFLQLSYSYRNSYSEQDRITHNNDGFGNYNRIDTASTKLLENDFNNQEISLNFQSMREKYNYSFGLSVQPSNSESRTFELDTAYTVKNNVVNFAPVFRYTYQWDRQTTLRVNYNGAVNQPSTTQLSNVRDESDPLNVRYGNPDLNPSFRNRFDVSFNKFNPITSRSMSLSANGGFVTNAIVNYSTVDSLGKRESTYENINGNWNTSINLNVNAPLRNRKFTISSGTSITYSADNGFTNGEKNTANNVSLRESLRGNFRSDLFDFGLSVNGAYNSTNNTLPGQINRLVYNFGGAATTTIYLPWNLSIESDMNYSGNSGYSDGYKQNEWLWNASLSKQLMNNNATLQFSAFDILKQRSNISRNASAQSLAYTSTNTIGSYFFMTFSYRFRSFKGGTPSFRRAPEEGMNIGREGGEIREVRRIGGGEIGGERVGGSMMIGPVGGSGVPGRR